jgi:DNA-binding beta-propeller fold protein YncE
MAVAIYPGGGLLVSDTGAGIVHFYDAERQKYRRLGSELDGGLRSPVGIAVMNDGTILVSDSRRRTIERFERDGDHLGSFAGEGIFQRPGGLTLDRETGKVFAVDVLKHAIVVLSEDGKVLHELCDNGDAPGELNFPTHISLDREGFLIISDSMNFRLQRLSTEGDPISTFGEPGDAQGNFSRPKGVASIDTGVYVAVEGLYDSIIFFDQNGTLLMTVGGTGSAPGQFWLPAGVAFDSTRNLLFVADSYNSRVQVFQYLPDSTAEVLR